MARCKKCNEYFPSGLNITICPACGFDMTQPVSENQNLAKEIVPQDEQNEVTASVQPSRHFPNIQLQYTVNPKENVYFAIRLIFSIICYISMASGLSLILMEEPLAFLFVLQILFTILLLFFIYFGLLMGYIKGNGVKITRHQFPDIYSILEKQCEKLGIREVPDTYILESGGVLNAFAAKHIGKNYVIIYSDILELAYEQGQDIVEFIIGHELGHIKRNHISKRLLLYPSCFIPFLSSAYSRACEYTCDNIGKFLSPEGAQKGILVLAAGKKLYKKVNAEEFIHTERYDGSFWKWFAEKCSSHPHLPKRLNNLLR